MEDTIIQAANIIMTLRQMERDLTGIKMVELVFYDDNGPAVHMGINANSQGFSLELWNEFYPFFEQALGEYKKALEVELHNLTGKVSNAEVSA